MGFSLLDVPIAGDIYNALSGNPKGAKEAYDQQIKASQASEERQRNFLMGQKQNALAFYAPLQHMFQSSYGTEGLMAPQVPGGSQPQMPGPMAAMYSGSAPPMPSGHAFGGR